MQVVRGLCPSKVHSTVPCLPVDDESVLIAMRLIFWGKVLHWRGGTYLYQIFMVDDIVRLQANSFLYCLDGEIHFVLGRLDSDIGTNGHVGMADPCVECPLIQCSRLFCCLVPGSVVGESIVLLSAIGCSIHEDNAVVSLISEPRPCPPLLVKHRLI